MTATADSKKRIFINAIKPGDRFDVQLSGEGTILLRRLEPVKDDVRPAKCKLVKKQGYTVLVTDKPVNEQALKEALAEFP